MKVSLTLVYLLGSVQAFVPASRRALQGPSTTASSSSLTTPRFTNTHLSFGIDPSHFSDGATSFAQLQDFMSSISLADATAAATDMMSGTASDVVEEAAKSGSSNGWFGFLTGPIGGLLQFIHSALVAVGLKSNSWGASIIFLTLLIKAATFPLTKQQLESTTKMQAMSPAIKEIQAKYQSNPEVMNQKIAEFYQVNEINPLAGCLPSLAQIPVFIGLYRAVLDLASQNKLDEPFLFLPNLEGPTYGADPAHGSDWLLQGWCVFLLFQLSTIFFVYYVCFAIPSYLTVL
jgi:YidC/Oxa1 family membrane protein insertase